MNFVNLTPHKISIWEMNETGQGFAEYKSEGVARVKEIKSDPINEVSYSGLLQVKKVKYSGITNLPAPKKDTGYIVSVLVAQACAQMGRTDDIFYPGELLRDKEGNVVGCGALYQIG